MHNSFSCCMFATSKRNNMVENISESKLNAISCDIRQDIPRLKELTSGCRFTFLYSNGTGEDGIILKETTSGMIKVLMGNRIRICEKETFKPTIIIGHDITLSDVLEWCRLKGFNITFDLDGYFYKVNTFLGFEMKSKKQSAKWILTSPYLKDQSEELILLLNDFRYRK